MDSPSVANTASTLAASRYTGASSERRNSASRIRVTATIRSATRARSLNTEPIESAISAVRPAPGKAVNPGADRVGDQRGLARHLEPHPGQPGRAAERGQVPLQRPDAVDRGRVERVGLLPTDEPN